MREVLGNALLADYGRRPWRTDDFGPEAAQGKILREGGQPVSRDAAAKSKSRSRLQRGNHRRKDSGRRHSGRCTKLRRTEMSALEQQPRTPERDAQMAQMREDYRALRNLYP